MPDIDPDVILSTCIGPASRSFGDSAHDLEHNQPPKSTV
jgi:hypothetical protein